MPIRLLRMSRAKPLDVQFAEAPDAPEVTRNDLIRSGYFADQRGAAAGRRE
jgi:hypothetical protein